jgi:hypothetical protein
MNFSPRALHSVTCAWWCVGRRPARPSPGPLQDSRRDAMLPMGSGHELAWALQAASPRREALRSRPLRPAGIGAMTPLDPRHVQQVVVVRR